jgi:hypothetical protein
VTADLAVAAIHEGWLLHSQGRGRTVVPGDPDLALLEGDRLYAEGLERLADRGDLDAIARLADVISVCARSHAEGRPDLAEDAWSNAPGPGAGPTSAPHGSRER